MRSMKKKYGSKKAKKVFYASKNKKTITGVEESVFNTYRTLAYLLEAKRKPVITHQATGKSYTVGAGHGQALSHVLSGDRSVEDTKREYRFRVPGDTRRRAVASLAAKHGSKTAEKDVKTLKKGSGVLTVRGKPGWHADSEGTQTEVSMPVAAHPDTKDLDPTLDPKTRIISRRTTSRQTDVTRPKARSVAGETTVKAPGGSLRKDGSRRPGKPEERETIIVGRERGPQGKRVLKKGMPTRWSGKEAEPTDDT